MKRKRKTKDVIEGVVDGEKSLLLGVLYQAMKDAESGDKMARRWLESDGAHFAGLVSPRGASIVNMWLVRTAAKYE